MDKPRFLAKLFSILLWLIIFLTVFQFLIGARNIANYEKQVLEQNIIHEIDNRIERGIDVFTEIKEKEEHYYVSMIKDEIGKVEYEIPKENDREFSVFLFGGSSVVFPVGEHMNFPEHLEEKVKNRTEANFSIYNFGMPGVSTSTILNSLERILEVKEPDMVVIYTGHNDYFLTHHMFTENTPDIFYDENVLWPLYNSLGPLIDRESAYMYDSKRITEYRMMTLAHSIGLVDGKRIFDLKKKTDKIIEEEYFEENIKDIQSLTEERSIDLVFLTTISRIRGVRTEEMFLSKDEMAEFHDFVDRAESYLEQEEFDRSLEIFGKALDINDNSSKIYERIGEIYEGREEYMKAQENFIKSKDRNVFGQDPRAPSYFNEILRNVEKEKVYTVDVRKKLLEDEDYPLMDNDFFDSEIHIGGDNTGQVAEKIFLGLEKRGLIDDFE